MKRILFILAALFATAQSQTIQTIGAPTTTVVSRGNFRTDSIFYLPKRQKLPTDSGAVRYQISDSSVYYWSGFQWLKLGVNIDTSSMLNPYVRGSGTANYLPKFNASRSIVDSKVYESATNLMFNTTTPYFTTSGIGSFDINGSTASVLVLRKADTARGYWSHNGSTMDINNLAAGDIRFYTNAQLRGRFQTDGTFRLNSLTGTGTRSVVADANGVLSASSTPTDLIDTTYISTRAWRQKGDDSLGAIIATKQNTLTNPVTGTGTTNYVPKFTGTSTIGNSLIYDNGTNIGIGNVSPLTPLHIGNRLVNNSVDAVLLVSRNVNDSSGSGNAHAFTDGSNVYRSGGMSYNSFDARINITGSNNMGHYAAFQAAPEYSNSGTMDEYFGFFSYIGTNAGTITHNYNNYVANPTGAGSVTNNYGLYVAAQTKGTNNYAVHLNNSEASGRYNLYVNGTAYNYLNGRLGVGTSSPATMLDVVGTGQFSGELRLNSTGSQIRFGGQGTGVQTGIFQGTNSSNLYIADYATGTKGIRIDAASGEVHISNTTDAGDYKLQVSGNIYGSAQAVFADALQAKSAVFTGNFNDVPICWFDQNNTTSDRSFGVLIDAGTTSGDYALRIRNAATSSDMFHVRGNGNVGVGLAAPLNKFTVSTASDETVSLTDVSGYASLAYRHRTTNAYRDGLIDGGNVYINSESNGEVRINTKTDAGDYKLQVSGNAYVTGTTVLAATSGNVGVGTASPSASAELDVTSTTGGFLPPRMTTTQRDAISSPAAGLVIYNTTTSKLQVYTTAWTDLH